MLTKPNNERDHTDEDMNASSDESEEERDSGFCTPTRIADSDIKIFLTFVQDKLTSICDWISFAEGKQERTNWVREARELLSTLSPGESAQKIVAEKPDRA